MQILEAFGNKLKELRTAAMLSQVELAKRSGIERAQISKIEKGTINVTLETIEKLSRAINIPMNKFLDIDYKNEMHPFAKWAGGKTQILSKIKELMPEEYNNYFEPFVGGGALLFEIAPTSAYINDSNSELMCVYNCFKNDEDFYSLLEELDKHEKNHNEEYYYMIREMDRDSDFMKLPIYVRAARMLYLNKSCFNGLYRVNAKGYFNVPSGKKEKVNTYDRKNMNAIKDYFNNNHINVFNDDFEVVLRNAKSGDFVYFDPPYDTLDEKDSFTSYSKESFGKEEQKRLSEVFAELSKKGVKCMLSNHNTKYINELYKDYDIHVISARRNINSKGNARGPIEEVIITNY